MFEQFTSQARDVVRNAQEQARELGHAFIGTEHLLLGLLVPTAGVAYDVLTAAGVTADRVRGDIGRFLTAPPGGLTATDAEALRTVGIDLDAVLARIEDSFGPGALASTMAPPPARWRRRRPARGQLPLSGRATKVLTLSLGEAQRLRHNGIGSEHLLLGLLSEGTGLAVMTLTARGLSLDSLRAGTIEAMTRAA